MLHQAKADIEARDKQGRSAVHRCAEQDLFELMLWVRDVKGIKVRGLSIALRFVFDEKTVGKHAEADVWSPHPLEDREKIFGENMDEGNPILQHKKIVTQYG